MSVNSSSSTNDSLPPLSSSSVSYDLRCYDSIVSGYIYLACVLTDLLLLLPLSVSVLHLGYQRWKHQRSVSSAAVLSLSDFVTYNMAVMELIGVFGNTFKICSDYANLPVMVWVGIVMGSFPWNGQMLFPILICVERYLAAVHPITYLRLKTMGSVSIRNISTVCVWLHSFGGSGLHFFIIYYSKYNHIINTCKMSIYLIAVTFCSLSVLCVLIRPGPGKAGGDRVRVDQSKQRAFHTILIMMGVLWLRFGGNLVCSVVGLSEVSYSSQCVTSAFSMWFNLPSSLVLPLLFLHRAGKLPGCKHNSESG